MDPMIEESARALHDAERSRVPIAPLSERYPSLTPIQSYAIQSAWLNLLRTEGARVVGHKIGLTSKAMQEQLGVNEPDYGFILDTMVVSSGSVLPRGAFLLPRIEPEIAFWLAEDLHGPGVTAEQVLAATQGVSAALELVDSRIENWRIKLVDTIADNASSARLIVSQQRVSPQELDLAAEGVELLCDGETVGAGTGIGGRIRKEDILAYVASRSAQPQPAAAPAPPPAAPKAAPAPATAGEDEELVTPSRMRLAIAEHMLHTKRTAPHATTFMEVDMTNIARWLEKNKEEFRRKNGYGISYVAFVMKATCEGLRKFPMANATWTEDNKIILKKRINLGLAVAIETGLVVPTVQDADQYTIAGLAKQVSIIAQKARANKLTVQDMQGSTFSVNNTGTFGTMFSTPLINQPHAGILSMEAVVKRPMVMEDDSIAIRHMMFLSFTFDHRILDGAGANGFLQAVRIKLQSYGTDIDVY